MQADSSQLKETVMQNISQSGCLAPRTLSYSGLSVKKSGVKTASHLTYLRTSTACGKLGI